MFLESCHCIHHFVKKNTNKTMSLYIQHSFKCELCCNMCWQKCYSCENSLFFSPAYMFYIACHAWWFVMPDQCSVTKSNYVWAIRMLYETVSLVVSQWSFEGHSLQICKILWLCCQMLLENSMVIKKGIYDLDLALWPWPWVQGNLSIISIAFAIQF